MTASGAEGVLITGVYGSGKSSVAAELAYLLEQRGEPYALLDLRAAAEAIAAGRGAGLADILVRNDRPVGVVAAELMTFLAWLPG